MDDLLDLNWSGDTNKNKPPSIPQKPSYLAGNPTSNRKQDAFADLLNLPSSHKSPDRSQLPLAEQQRLIRQEAMGAQSPASFASVSSSAKSSPRQQHATAATTTQNTLESLLDPFGGKSSNASSTTNTPLNALRSQASASNQRAQAQWNFDLLEQSNTAASSPSLLDDPFDVASLPARSSAPPQQTAASNISDDDNPLGILSQPVQKPRTPSPEPQPASISPTPSETPSPKPPAAANDMMIAQLVDMGFTDEQAKVALEATGGHDLQDAIDLLVQNAEAVTIQERAAPPSRSDTARARHALFDEVPQAQSPRQQQRRREHSEDQHRSHQQQPSSPSREGPEGTDADSFQKHKEKLVAQANEIGGFLFKNASMFVKTGRERINKAVEDWQEQQRAEQRYRAEGRPKWMRDDIQDEEAAAAAVAASNRPTEKFVDDDSSDEDPALERERELAWKKQQEAKRREYVQQMRRQQQQERERKERQEDKEVYVSPSRRRPTPSSRSSSKSSMAAAAATTPATRSPASPAKRPRTRPVVNASSDVMTRVNRARQLGNDKFKLGQFGEADSAYSQAITMLPDGHDHLVILYNNRAVARLKIGEYKKCIEDCTQAIDMAKSGGDDNVESDGVTIRWREQTVKALNRKGEALENLEKYQDAIKTYEHIVKLDGARNAKVNQALARCRRAINPPPPPSPANKKLPSPSTPSNNATAFPGVDYSMFEPKSASGASSSGSRTPSTPANVDKSKAVAELRAQAAKQEAEDAERMQKTDDVNARIVQWKAGKEHNLRALLATLDTLLWPGAQWRGAQMSELIEPKRCKIVYMKAIAKVHPDKLPSDVTVEQRMLASAIFSTLNEAWDTFKSQI